MDELNRSSDHALLGTPGTGVAGADAEPDRRAPEPLAYTPDQLLGRAPIRLRRRTDKLRLAGHLLVAGGLFVLTAWWVIPLHSFAGPVLFTIAPGRGVHVGDLPTLVFLGIGLRSLFVARRILRTTFAGVA